jgi:Fe2+ or Zn2+ uptake regulation protein
MKPETSQESLRQRGIRLTRQRQLLLDLIEQSGEHLDAETLYTLAHQRDSKLNRVTVYRTLKTLKEGGLVDELDLMHYGGDQHYYETRRKQEHAHIICLRCGRVEEFYGDPLSRLRRQIEATLGFQILIARTEIGGYCSHCRSVRVKEIEKVIELAEAVPAVPPEAAAAPKKTAKAARQRGASPAKTGK